jgi:hypothetical protein
MKSTRDLIVSMNKLISLSICVVFAALAGCQKQQSEEERKAEVEREVQQRLATEQQATEKEQLVQREADINAREKALAAKEEATAAPTVAPQIRPTSMAQRMRDSEGRPATATYSMFYTRLEPYGEWFETNDYGYVFQPRQAQSRSWRPYTSGHWVYTDVGWTWISDEPFGWAAYHYGRWTRLRDVGWVWVPGEQWAPAWVSWRKSNDYVGWAPLPPEAHFDQRTGIHNWSDNYYDIGPDQYCFVATREFGSQKIDSAVVPSERNLTIVNQTTNVTNITYNNTTIVNQGPNYDELRGQTQQPIARLRLERRAELEVEAANPQPVVTGGVIQISAPVIARAQPNERPRSVKQTIAQGAVDLGWAAIADHQAADKARAKMKSEATPPSNAPPKTFTKPVTQTSAAAAETTMTVPPRSTSAPREGAVAHSPVAAPTATATPVNTPAVQRSAPARFIETPTPAPSATPRAIATPGRERTPLPTTSPSATASASVSTEQTPTKAQKMESQALKLKPRKIVPMESVTPSTSSPTASATSPPLPSDKGESKKEKKELKREEKQELKRERRQGEQSLTTPSASPSPSAAP